MWPGKNPKGEREEGQTKPFKLTERASIVEDAHTVLTCLQKLLNLVNKQILNLILTPLPLMCGHHICKIP